MMEFTREQHVHTAKVLEREASLRSGNFREILLTWAKNAHARANAMLPLQGDLFAEDAKNAKAVKSFVEKRAGDEQSI